MLPAKISRIDWRPCWRLVPSRFPPAGLFDRVADPADLDVVFAIEALTNDRLRDEAGEISLVAAADRIAGPGTTPIMAAFTHLNPEGSRFCDGSYGVYYAAKDIDTAIAETCFHRSRFLAATQQAPIDIDMRSYASDLNADLHDIRGRQTELPEIYDADTGNYAAAQALARQLRADGADGIVYSSVRAVGGECVAVFKPRLLAPVKQGAHYCYVWDGRQISAVYKKELYHPGV
ncbi:RES family NAD+ phosphorylase [Methylomonas sp. MO1]|uniref:RES family NAD+ phosphorylase n=1 Tax=unclassified Methylomonas TaxID=2608980 RepID=UPI00047D6EAE|nr:MULTISPECIES: RES family NAD+ phosphorylase [unclassified Methylomonas]MDT4289477.1 RES family NAD+ phosphorylase [Methylomonas sp. MO1]